MASMLATNKVFERYFQIDPDDLRDIYQATRSGKELEKRKTKGRFYNDLVLRLINGGGGGSRTRARKSPPHAGAWIETEGGGSRTYPYPYSHRGLRRFTECQLSIGMQI